MTQKQLIETVKQHHPNLQDAQIRIFLNKALDEFCRRTEILKSTATFNTVADKRYYTVAEILQVSDMDIIEIYKVHYDGYEIPKLQGTPEKEDLT